MTTQKPTGQTQLFQSVRTSRDHALVAVFVAIVVAFASQAGAFLPRLGSGASTAQATPAPAAAHPAAIVAGKPAPATPRG